ncbi:GntR family transcriptional regulator [Candidatus Accumulibacter vicinus]|uniref:HTH-type transcriptional repressor YvoA n=1 Tax=Candidatus Accumulibacter vicinus TaxID=2954382 RepID=A0A084Y642_9PROT|nr:GntR family transcriptional regulator [Candidatus Accumulibacter vicinus]KFB70186.1 MAG: HTH-type transcriptional repressor YvoA [Candidatus Accumulibacter vicinus]
MTELIPVEALAERLRPNPGNSQPYYQQILQQLTGLIDSGELAEGANLPPERVLADLLAVSRTTVKRCYDALRETHKLASFGRGGTVVRGTPRVSPEMGRLKGFSEEMRELGMTPSTRLLERVVIQDRTLASMFGRPSSARFLKLVRLRLGDEQPMSYETAWYDLGLAPDLENWDTNGSAYAFLRDPCGIVLADADQSIEAVLSSEVESEVFGFSAPAPCLLLKRRTYSSHRKLVEYVEGLFRGDAYAYRLKLRA